MKQAQVTSSLSPAGASAALPPLFFGAASLEALACAVWLLSIPADAKNSFLGGYSLTRLSMAAGLLLAFGLFGFLAVRARGGGWSGWFHKIFERGLWKLVLALALAEAAACAVLLALPLTLFGDWKYAFARLRPLILWGALASGQFAILTGGLAALRAPGWLLSIRSEFAGSADRIRRQITLIPAAGMGASLGVALAVFLRAPSADLLASLPLIPSAAIAAGLLFLLFGLFYNRVVIRTAAVLFFLLLAVSAVFNPTRWPGDNQRYVTGLSPLPSGSALDLGSRYHYSLSLYHILSVHCPGSQVIAAPGLLEEWDLREDRLLAWAQAERVEVRDYRPKLSEDDVVALESLDLASVEINTLLGTYTYHLPAACSPAPARLVLAWHDWQRYLIPAADFARLFSGREISQ